MFGHVDFAGEAADKVPLLTEPSSSLGQLMTRQLQLSSPPLEVGSRTSGLDW